MADTESTTERIAHTPGPWTVMQGSDTRDLIVAEPTGNTVCEPNIACYDFAKMDPGVRTIGLDEAKANACLIAAAPEMLQALREVVGAHAEAGNCFYCLADLGEPHEDDCTMHFVLDAIAKAEGRS